MRGKREKGVWNVGGKERIERERREGCLESEERRRGPRGRGEKVAWKAGREGEEREGKERRVRARREEIGRGERRGERRERRKERGVRMEKKQEGGRIKENV